MRAVEKHHHHHHHLLGFHLLHLIHVHKREGMPPKGCMAIKVGSTEEKQSKFIVPVVYLNHPLFQRLLKEAEEEYGFDQDGVITLPCYIDDFRDVKDTIDREIGAAAHHHHHHFHFAGCFRA